MLMPEASRKSAEPQSEDAARFPCFATLMPPAAATSAEIEEMLKVLEPSPPVPTISSVGLSYSTLVACARIAAAQPEISSVVSDLALFVDMAAKKAAFCTCELSPLITSFMTAYASS